MLGINMSNVETAGTYPRPNPGGYVIEITSAENNVKKERVDIEFDIVEGRFAGYYKDMQSRLGWHTAKFSKSYKEKALPFFRSFIEAVVGSNGNTEGLVIGDFEDVDETKLVGKRLGMIVGEEEYMGNDGKKKVRLDNYNALFVTVNKIHSGNYSVPPLKPLQDSTATAPVSGVVDTTAAFFGPLSDDDTPF